MPESVEAHFLHTVPLDESGKLGCQIVRLHPLAQLVHECKAVVFVVVTVAADLLVQLLRRLDLCKVFLEFSHHRQSAHTGFGFCRLLLDDLRFPTHIDRGHRPLDGQCSPFKVDGVPLEPQHLATAQENYKKKMADNAVIPLYQKYYKRYAARVRVRQIEEPDFRKWKYQTMAKRDECSDGKITLSEFEEWLEASFPNRKKRMRLEL